MNVSDLIALVAVIVAPLSALAGAWVNDTLSRRARRHEEERAATNDALRALGRMKSLLLDAQPAIIHGNQSREYATPAEAVEAYYARWADVREPFVLLTVTHPIAEVRQLAYDCQAYCELSMRFAEQQGAREPTQKLFKVDGEWVEGYDTESQRYWNRAVTALQRLGEILSPFESRRESATELSQK